MYQPIRAAVYGYMRISIGIPTGIGLWVWDGYGHYDHCPRAYGDVRFSGITLNMSKCSSKARMRLAISD